MNASDAFGLGPTKYLEPIDNLGITICVMKAYIYDKCTLRHRYVSNSITV